MRLPTYSKYKPSGVGYLGEVPEHWSVTRLRRRAQRIQTGSTPPTVEAEYYDNGTVPWYGPGSFDDQIALTRPVKMLHWLAVEKRAVRMFRSGATMVVTIGATLGKVSSLLQAGCCNQQITAVEFDQRSVHPRFATYQIKQLENTLRTIAPRATLPILDQDGIGDLSIALPNLNEQHAIADFLDRRTGEIDTLVAKKRTLIERLNEKRAALISRTVTRGLPPDAACAAGLDPHPSLEPSGIDWLGDVPEHWELAKLSRVTVSRCDGPFGSGLKSEHYTEGKGIRVVRLQNIRFAEFDDRDIAFIEPEYYRELGDHDVFDGDVLIAGLGDENNPVGRACVAPPALGPAMVKADCFRFRVDRGKVDAAYVALQLSATAYGLAGALASGTTRSRMNLSATATRVIAIPPLIEQISIVRFLTHVTAEIDSLITKLEAAIERLHEYRAALITGAVTGKVDVRGAVVPEEDAA